MSLSKIPPDALTTVIRIGDSTAKTKDLHKIQEVSNCVKKITANWYQWGVDIFV